jgi:osmotically-inducible protein OsmY
MHKFLLAATLLLLGSTSHAAVTKAHPAASQPRLGDAEIERNIRTKLAKSKIGKDGLEIHVKNGVATWTGSTNVMQHKGAATRMARTAGAVQVINNIKLSDAARQKAAGNLTGGARKALVKSN